MLFWMKGTPYLGEQPRPFGRATGAESLSGKWGAAVSAPSHSQAAASATTFSSSLERSLVMHIPTRLLLFFPSPSFQATIFSLATTFFSSLPPSLSSPSHSYWAAAATSTFSSSLSTLGLAHGIGRPPQRAPFGGGSDPVAVAGLLLSPAHPPWLGHLQPKPWQSGGAQTMQGELEKKQVQPRSENLIKRIARVNRNCFIGLLLINDWVEYELVPYCPEGSNSKY